MEIDRRAEQRIQVRVEAAAEQPFFR